MQQTCGRRFSGQMVPEWHSVCGRKLTLLLTLKQTSYLVKKKIKEAHWLFFFWQLVNDRPHYNWLKVTFPCKYCLFEVLCFPSQLSLEVSNFKHLSPIITSIFGFVEPQLWESLSFAAVSWHEKKSMRGAGSRETHPLRLQGHILL